MLWKRNAVKIMGIIFIFLLGAATGKFYSDIDILSSSLSEEEEEKPHVTTYEGADPKQSKSYTSELRVEEESGTAEVSEETLELGKNESVYATLRNLGLSPLLIQTLVKSSKKYVDLSLVPSGMKLTLKRVGEDAEPVEIVFHLNVRESLHFTKAQNGAEWTVHKDIQKIHLEQHVYQGVVHHNLWLSANEAGLDGTAIAMLADIFAWQVDFERQIRPGDSWKLVIEKELLEDGSFYGWGNILAAKFTGNAGDYKAFRFVNGNSVGYYDANGENMKGKFLRSPLKYSRISSPFQRKRYHPILKVNRPHLGVDYAARAGTPIRSVGDGVISILGRRGGNGNMIKIRHNSKYETAYKHLSGFAKGLRQGRKVAQGQVIGYVGSTGLATGPHLHFEFYENGRYTDPLGVKFPKQDSIGVAERVKFAEVVKRVGERLDGRNLSS